MPALPVDIVTGFLGSGKTTLLKHVLDQGLNGRRVAVIMNEIGEIGIDGKVITGLRAVQKMVELNSGCICCSISGQFALALQEIIDTIQPELIVIETTGVADAKPLIIDVHENGLRLDAVITVVDASNILQAARKFIVADKQIEAADFLILNKVDLIEQDQRTEVEGYLRRHNERATILPTTFGQVPSHVMFDTGAASRDLSSITAEPHPPHLDQDAMRVVTFQTHQRLDQERFKRLLDALSDSVYRAKGFLRFTNSHWSCLFNYTSGRSELRWHEPLDEDSDFEGRAVFIGTIDESEEEWIQGQLSACIAPA